MKRNLGNRDILARLVTAGILILLVVGGALSLWASWLLLAISLVLVWTAVQNSCPIYRIVGYSTYKPQQTGKPETFKEHIHELETHPKDGTHSHNHHKGRRRVDTR